MSTQNFKTMKITKFIPAIALLFVVALSSFTTAAPKQGNFTDLYKYISGVLQETDASYISTICASGQIECAVDILNGGSVSAAQSYLNSNSIVFPTTSPFTVTITDFDAGTAGNQSMTVYPRP